MLRALTPLAILATATAAPKEFQIDVFSDEVKNATAICFDDTGNLYVTETYRWNYGVVDNRDHTYWIMDDLATETNEQRVAYYNKYAAEKLGDPDFFTRESERVVVLDKNSPTPKVFAENFKAAEDGPAIGLLADDQGKILLANIPHIWQLEDTNGDLKADKREKLISGFGVKTSLSGHDLHGLVWGPTDGKLYFSMGDRGFNITTKEGNVLKDTNSGAAFRCDPDGSNLEIFYHNLRNPQEIAFNEYGDLFTVDNNCDQGDSARVCYLIEGGDAGWTLGTQALTTYSDFIEDGAMEQRPNWLEEGHWKTRFKGQPAFLLPPIAHLTNGPSGMCFNSGTSTPARYQNNFFVCDYKGAPNVCFLYSFKVKQDGAGYTMEDGHVFHSGIPNTDVEIGYDGKIYLADFGGGWKRTDTGKIYTLTDPEKTKSPTVTQTQQLFAEGFPTKVADLFKLLSHSDMRVRQRAQFNLVKQGTKNADQLSVFAQKSQAPAAYHAIWALRQLGATAHLHGILNHPDPELRAQSIRALGDLKYTPAASQIIAAINDPSPRVRTFAAIAAGKLGDRRAIPAALQLLEKNNNTDLNERHAATYTLTELLRNGDIDPKVTEQPAAIRLGLALALRRQHNPLIAQFLNDPDPAIVATAIRAINDENIKAAVPALASFAEKLTTEGHGKAPELDEPLFRRLINANVRTGKPTNAKNLVALAANSKLPETWRSLSLLALGTFTAPQSIDPTLGVYRPLQPRDPKPIRDAIAEPLKTLFNNSTGDIAAATTRIITTFEIPLDPQLLTRRVLDYRQPEPLRVAALQQLASDPKFDNQPLFRSALADSSAALRATAAPLWAKRYPENRLEAIDALLEQSDNTDLRTAYTLLSTDKSPAATQRLDQQLTLLKNGTLYRTVHLDLYQAIQAQANPNLIAKLQDIDPFQLTREGGDPIQGQKVFENQGICLKCHKALRGGGDAGPDLRSIARLRRDDELLDSLLHPNKHIVPGYGIAAITLKDGTTIAGTPMSETKTHLTLKDAAGATQKIPLTEIQTRTPEVSAMPPMFTTNILTKADLRDVMAFLKTLE